MRNWIFNCTDPIWRRSVGASQKIRIKGTQAHASIDFFSADTRCFLSRVYLRTRKRSLPIRKITTPSRGCKLIIESRGLMRDDKKILRISFRTEMKCSKDRNRSLSAIYFRARNLSFGLPCTSLILIAVLDHENADHEIPMSLRKSLE